MASIFKKIFLPKSQWMILDFIDKNADLINYSMTENEWYTWHNLSITNPDFSLHASLRKEHDHFKPVNQATYSFKCNKSDKCQNKECVLATKSELSGFTAIDYDGAILQDSFALKVYNRMLTAHQKRINKQRILCDVK